MYYMTKGNMAKIIGDVREKNAGKMKEEVEEVYTTTLKRETLFSTRYVQIMTFLIYLKLLHNLIMCDYVLLKLVDCESGSPTTT